METIQPKTGFKKWLPLLILSLGITIIILDTTILNVSLRTIINDLQTNIQSIQWVITAYSLILAAFTVTGGRLGDLFGRKKMFMLGAIIFAIGSFIASISQSVSMMIIGEAIIEGLGAALMMPATMSLIVSNYKGRDRQIGFGIWGGIAGGSAALGPVVGGWLTTYMSWRWAFRINVGVAALLILGSIFITDTAEKEDKPSLDIVGVVLSAVGLLSIVFGFIKASDYGWLWMKDTVVFLGITLSKGSLSIVPIAVLFGLLILGLFTLWEKHMMAIKKTPLVSLNLFKNTQFTVAVCIALILSLGQAGLSFAIPVFLQSVKQLNALDTGISMLPMTLTLLIAAPFSAVMSKYIAPKRIVQVGLTLDILAFLALRAALTPTATAWSFAPGFVLFGLGMGFMMSQISNIALSAVSVKEAGEVSGVNSTFRTVGQTLGSAIIGAVLLSALTSGLTTGVAQSTVIPASAKTALSEAVSQQTSNIEFGAGTQTVSDNLPITLQREIKKISQQATVDATRTTFLLGIGFILIALVLSIKLPKTKNIEVEKPLSSSH